MAGAATLLNTRRHDLHPAHTVLPLGQQLLRAAAENHIGVADINLVSCIPLATKVTPGMAACRSATAGAIPVTITFFGARQPAVRARLVVLLSAQFRDQGGGSRSLRVSAGDDCRSQNSEQLRGNPYRTKIHD
jgi:hypothetical protein